MKSIKEKLDLRCPHGNLEELCSECEEELNTEQEALLRDDPDTEDNEGENGQ